MPRLILSKNAHHFGLGVERQRAAESGDPVDGRVIEVVKGGFILDLGLRVLPASLVDIRRPGLDEFLGQDSAPGGS